MNAERRFYLLCCLGWIASLTEPDLEIRRWQLRLLFALGFGLAYVFKDVEL